MGLIGIFSYIVRLFVLLVFVIYFYILEIIKVLFFFKKKDVCNEIVLIMGVGYGIGWEIVLEFGRWGVWVVIWDINKVFVNYKVIYIMLRGGFFVFNLFVIKIYIIDLFN